VLLHLPRLLTLALLALRVPCTDPEINEFFEHHLLAPSPAMTSAFSLRHPPDIGKMPYSRRLIPHYRLRASHPAGVGAA
jgi:hypothetical protein